MIHPLPSVAGIYVAVRCGKALNMAVQSQVGALYTLRITEQRIMLRQTGEATVVRRRRRLHDKMLPSKSNDR
jgi:hypothetical protein